MHVHVYGYVKSYGNFYVLWANKACNLRGLLMGSRNTVIPLESDSFFFIFAFLSFTHGGSSSLGFSEIGRTDFESFFWSPLLLGTCLGNFHHVTHITYMC